MIVETMTRDEVFREITADDLWVSERCIGLQNKYRKELNNKKVPHLAVLGVVSYTTPNHNKTVGIVQKICRNNGKEVSCSISNFYEFFGSDGKKRYLFPVSYMTSKMLQTVIVLSEHSILRLRERCGKTPLDILMDFVVINGACWSFSIYPFKNKEDEAFTVIGDTILLAKNSDWGTTITTALHKDQLFSNQVELKDWTNENIDILKYQVEKQFRNNKAA